MLRKIIQLFYFFKARRDKLFKLVKLCRGLISQKFAWPALLILPDCGNDSWNKTKHSWIVENPFSNTVLENNLSFLSTIQWALVFFSFFFFFDNFANSGKGEITDSVGTLQRHRNRSCATTQNSFTALVPPIMHLDSSSSHWRYRQSNVVNRNISTNNFLNACAEGHRGNRVPASGLAHKRVWSGGVGTVNCVGRTVVIKRTITYTVWTRRRMG